MLMVYKCYPKKVWKMKIIPSVARNKVRYNESFDILSALGFMAILAGAPGLHEVIFT